MRNPAHCIVAFIRCNTLESYLAARNDFLVKHRIFVHSKWKALHKLFSYQTIFY